MGLSVKRSPCVVVIGKGNANPVRDSNEIADALLRDLDAATLYLLAKELHARMYQKMTMVLREWDAERKAKQNGNANHTRNLDGSDWNGCVGNCGVNSEGAESLKEGEVQLGPAHTYDPRKMTKEEAKSILDAFDGVPPYHK